MKLRFFLALTLAASGCARSWAAGEEPRQIARISEPRLTEISGLAMSRRFLGWMWAHNDSGDSARLFLLDSKGATRAVVSFPGVSALDWEEMAVAGDSKNSFVVVADMGDNLFFRGSIAFYRFAEKSLPDFRKPGAPREFSIRPQVLEARYEDDAHDCEALALSARGEMLLVTKSTGPSRFYLARWPARASQTPTVFKFVGERQFGSTAPGQRRVREMLVTGASLSPSQNRLAIVTYSRVYAWSLPRGPWDKIAWQTVLARQPQEKPLPPLPQCESVAWNGENQVLVTTEGNLPPLWAVPIP